MNLLSDEQAAARQLALPADGLLEAVSPEFIAELQSSGVFVEYNQEVIVSAGELVDYVSCIVVGELKVSRLDADYARAPVARLRVGDWFGETHIFVRIPSEEEVFADGEVVLWTMPPDALRKLFFDEPRAVQLLINIAARMAERLAAKN